MISNNKRIAKNTLMLYFRMLLNMGISLYTVRVVLNVLGVEDYGIYNVVGGIVALFVFFTSSMSSATQRFFSFTIGQGDLEKLKNTFTVNWIVYGAIALIAVSLLESIGLWFVNEHLRIPDDRFESVKWVYHLSVLTFIARILSSPFVAIIIAHEDMHFYAYISIAESLMKLCAVFLLTYIPGDKLELYGALVLVTVLVNTVVLTIVCVGKYEECQFKKFYWDKTLFREIVGFTGWTLFGHFTSIARKHGVTILLNQFFNPAVVAARAIATNVATQINVFSNGFNVGLYPPIIKSYAAGEKSEMFSLVFNGSKITFFLMWVFALPLFLEMENILRFWLGSPPADAVLFTRLALIEVLIMSLSLPIATAARAPGRMKAYESILGSIQIAIFAVSLFVLQLGGPAHAVFVVAIVANLMMFFVRLLIVGKLIGLPVIAFFRKVVFRVLGVVFLSALLSYALDCFLSDDLIFVGFSILSSVVLTSVCAYFFGLDRIWRVKIRRVALSKIRRFA